MALRLSDGCALGRQVKIVETPERNIQLAAKLECGIGAIARAIQQITPIRPGMFARPGPEGVGSGCTEGVPVTDGETQMLLHGLAVGFESQDIVRVRALVGDTPDAREKLPVACENGSAHTHCPLRMKTHW